MKLELQNPIPKRELGNDQIHNLSQNDDCSPSFRAGCRTNRQDSRFARLRRPKGERHGCLSCIQSGLGHRSARLGESVARMEPLAAQSGRTLTTKPGLRRKRLHPGYDTRRYTQVRESRKSRHFGRDAENQAMEGNKSVVQCLIQVTCQPVVLCSRLQGHLSWPPVCHPWTLDFGIPAEMTGFFSI